MPVRGSGLVAGPLRSGALGNASPEGPLLLPCPTAASAPDGNDALDPPCVPVGVRNRPDLCEHMFACICGKHQAVMTTIWQMVVRPTVIRQVSDWPMDIGRISL
jgi:hypothetical protein